MNPPANLGNPPQIRETVQGPEKDPPRARKVTEMTLKKIIAHVIPTKNIFCKKNGPKRSFVTSAVVRPIYIRLYGATAAN